MHAHRDRVVDGEIHHMYVYRLLPDNDVGLEWNGCRWVAEEDHIVNFPTVRLKGGMPIRVTAKD